jgi:PAS domain S-box-containing protein
VGNKTRSERRRSAPARHAERDALLGRYRAMTEDASDIIIMLEDDHVVCASAALGRLLGRAPEEFQNGGYLNTVHPDDLDEAKKLLGRPAPGEMRTATYRVRHADGRYLWFEVTTRGVYDEATGAFLREVSVGRDITERKENELRLRAAHERAEAASKAKSVFLANMSHELRTPLNAIIGFSDMMKSRMFGALGDSHYDDYAVQIHESGNRLLGLISDILDMARLEAGLVELDFEALDVVGLLECCAGNIRERAEQRGVAVNVDVEGGLALTADRRAVKQIVLNLLSNAVKFTEAGGQVWLGARRVLGGIAIVVRDNGRGIPAEDLPRLGRAFEQVCTEPRITKNGAGLGLALARALAAKHGGTLAIESEEGRGTAVVVFFPTEPARAVA